MRYLPLLFLIAALACFAFAYWGIETPSGRQSFDEMAGIIPMGIGLVGAVLMGAAVAIWGWRWFRA